MKDTYERWTPQEEMSLKKLYPELEPALLEERFGRKFENIRYKAKKLNVRKWSRRRWTFDDIIFLCKNHQRLTVSELSFVLKRTRRAIKEALRDYVKS